MDFMGILIIWLICGLLAMAIYKGKGRSAFVGFMAGFLLGPLGVVLTLVSGSNLPKCPYCAERIQREAIVCPHCQRDLKVNVSISA